ncbi:MAG: hypothetical protein BWY42_01602 [Candidatus Omnitrophica bacterium ADurb.Bin277]|nr:MAG: hypothetical protein BWY42_01602 [Candidatus Omnitrophica bacterium ADurb.Bin277]
MVTFGPFLIPALYLCARDLAWIRASRIRVWILRALFAGGAVLCAYYAWRLKKKYGVSLGAILAGATAAYFFDRRSLYPPVLVRPAAHPNETIPFCLGVDGRGHCFRVYRYRV